MSASSQRTARKLLSGLGLMASASVLSLIVAGEAQAQCVVASPSGAALNNLPDDAEVACSGTVTGQTIIANGISADIDVAAGSTFNSGTVVINGPDARVYFGLPGGATTTVQDLAVSTTPGQTLTNVRFFAANVTNLNAQIDGQQSTLRFLNGTTATSATGAIMLTGASNNAGPGGNGILAMENSSLTAIGASTGNTLLTTGAGNETVFLFNSTVTTLSDGRLIDTGDGNDQITLTNATLLGAGPGGHIIDGGNGTDAIQFTASGGSSYDLQVGNVEQAVFFGSATPMVISGSGSYSNVAIASGTVQFDELAALGLGNAAVTVQSGSLTILNENVAHTFNQTISGGGTIRQNGGDYTFNGLSTGFTGRYEINGGTTTLTTNSALGTADIANDGTLFIGDLVIANDISGAGGVTKTGSGTARLTGNNTFSGLLDIQGGSLEVASADNLGESEVTSTNPGGAILVIGNPVDETLENDVTGNLILVKDGAGVLTLTGSNSYTLGTLINSGAVRVDGFARLGTGQVIANGGGSLILDYNGAGQLLQTTPFLTGGGAFIKEGTGDVVMSLASTYTGGTTIREGSLGLNNGGALGTGSIQVDAGATLGIGNITLGNVITGAGSVVKTASGQATLSADNSGFTGLLDVQDGAVELTDGRAAGSGDLNIASGSLVFVNSAVGDTTIAADISGAGDLENSSNTRLTLTGNNSLTGVVFISNGTLQVEGSQNVGTAAINIVGSAAQLNLHTAGSTTLSNNVLGNGSLVKTGSGTVFVTGSNSYAGGTDIQQGAIRVTDVSFLGSGAITVQQGAALDLAIAGQQTLNQTIAGAGLLRKSDTGDLTLLGNGLTGGVDITGGRVIVNTSAALGGGPVSTALDTQLVFDTAGTETMCNVISGAGTLTKEGSGVLVIQNSNTFTGGTLINEGRLGLNHGQGLGTGDVLVLQDAILSIGGVTLANNVSGGGQIIKTASNTGALTGTNTHSGGTVIQQGTLVVNSPAALGSGEVSIGGGAFLAVDYSGANPVALDNLLTGGGVLVKDGTGAVIVNAANTYSGGTAINSGRLGVNSGNALGTGGVVINSGAELAIGDVTLANALSGTGTLIKTSAGSASLTGTNTHSGGTQVLGGTLNVAGTAQLGSGAVTIGSASTLNFANASAVTFGNALGGPGTFTKSGAGQLTFGNNFTLGALNLVAGRTRLNAVATTGVTVGNGATLDGTGRIVGNLTNNGVVAPGNSIGTLTVEGNYVHNAGSVLEIEFDGAGGIDLLAVTGTATLNGGTLRFISTNGAEGSGGTFLTATGGITGTFATVETVGAQLPLAVIYQPTAGIMAPSVLTARPSTFNAQSLAGADTALAFIDTLGGGQLLAGEGQRAWLQGFGAWGSRSASGTTLAYDHDVYGLAGGITLAAGENLTLGAAIGWASGDITLGSNGGGGEQSSVLGSLTARYNAGGVTLGGGLVYGRIDQDTLRNVSFSGFSASVTGETDSDIVAAFGEVDAPLATGDGWSLSGLARASYVHQSQQGYTEGGTSPLRLAVDDIGTSTLEGQAMLSGRINLMNGAFAAEDSPESFDLRLDGGLRYLAALGDRAIPVTFAASSAGVTLQGDTRDAVQAVGGLGLSYTARSGMMLDLGYRAGIGRRNSHEVRATISMGF